MSGQDYELRDSGGGRKLERFGAVTLARPCAQAVWGRSMADAEWAAADAAFDREEGHRWTGRDRLPERWTIEIDGLVFRLSGTDFGHLGVFPEQRESWRWIAARVAALRAGAGGRAPAVLNLFAYSGGSTLAAARAGAEVCHVDASQGMVAWARDNAALNGLGEAPIRWITDDAVKFLAREARREHRYHGIVLDPPSFGRGKRGEVYKIERDLPDTLERCRALLAPGPGFLLLSAHTPGLTPVALANLLRPVAGGRGGSVEAGEMLLRGAADVPPVPSGAFAHWSA
jgi:23S rRNA (cytosine1962-C5)-methyltransferase